MKILEPKSTISKIKNSLARLNRFEMTEVSRCEYIKRNYDIWKQKKNNIEKNEQFVICGTVPKGLTYMQRESQNE